MVWNRAVCSSFYYKESQRRNEAIDTEQFGKEKINMNINIHKTKSMLVAQKQENPQIKVEGRSIEQMEVFKYLGTIMGSDGRQEQEVIDKSEKGIIHNALKITFVIKKKK